MGGSAGGCKGGGSDGKSVSSALSRSMFRVSTTIRLYTGSLLMSSTVCASHKGVLSPFCVRTSRTWRTASSMFLEVCFTNVSNSLLSMIATNATSFDEFCSVFNETVTVMLPSSTLTMTSDGSSMIDM